MIAHILAGTMVHLAGGPARTIDRDLTFDVTRATRREVVGETCDWWVCVELRVARADLVPIVKDDVEIGDGVYLRAGTPVPLHDDELDLRVAVDPSRVGDLAKNTIDQLSLVPDDPGTDVELAAGTVIRDRAGNELAVTRGLTFAVQVGDLVRVSGDGVAVIGIADATAITPVPEPSAGQPVGTGAAFATISPPPGEGPVIRAGRILYAHGRRVGEVHQPVRATRLGRGKWRLRVAGIAIDVRLRR